jgi:OOP family OmpA-OmpF porin
MQKIPTLLAMAAVAACVPLHVFAAPPTQPVQGYLLDGSGEFVKNGFGECWRLGAWTPALAMGPCDIALQLAVVVPPQPAPPPVAAAPTPLPAPVPLVPVAQNLRYSGDALFGFDKATLQPEGKTVLDDLVRELRGATYDKVIVIGHTDRLGSAAYNQKLSDQRAQTVRDYLVGQSVGANVIEARGLGETQPTEETAACKGNTKSAKLIACLQPDRRVEVEMQGRKTQMSAQ